MIVIGIYLSVCDDISFAKPSINLYADIGYVLHQTTTKKQTTVEIPLLYLILFLHQTTTNRISLRTGLRLYLILFLHQTTTNVAAYTRRRQLYLILFLHQTTTKLSSPILNVSCILFYFYIKPQRLARN